MAFGTMASAAPVYDLEYFCDAIVRTEEVSALGSFPIMGTRDCRYLWTSDDLRVDDIQELRRDFPELRRFEARTQLVPVVSYYRKPWFGSPHTKVEKLCGTTTVRLVFADSGRKPVTLSQGDCYDLAGSWKGPKGASAPQDTYTFRLTYREGISRIGISVTCHKNTRYRY